MLRFCARRRPTLSRRISSPACTAADERLVCWPSPETSVSWIPRLSNSRLSIGREMRGGGGGGGGGGLIRLFSSSLDRRDEVDEVTLEEEAEKKVGWLLKGIFIATAGVVAWQFFPYMGENLLLQSISLLRVKDPLFKRMGASRLSRFAIDDGRRMKVVELGGAQELINMLESAKDDKTRKFALKALLDLSHSDVASDALSQAGAAPIVRSTPDSIEYPEINAYKSSLLKKLQQVSGSNESALPS